MSRWLLGFLLAAMAAGAWEAAQGDNSGRRIDGSETLVGYTDVATSRVVRAGPVLPDGPADPQRLDALADPQAPPADASARADGPEPSPAAGQSAAADQAPAADRDAVAREQRPEAGGLGATVGEAVSVSITFYTCPPYCGAMANGQPVYEGAAACGYAFELGQRFRILGDPTGRTYLYADRGLGGYWWVDIFFAEETAGRAWARQVGTRGTIELLP